ncbi:MAG: ABC transporter permease subunit/CPBP intramembrane protease [Fuerstiella sp.]
MTGTSDSGSARVETTGRTWRLAVKELREILRDRRTVLTLVLMPLLVYPLLGVIMRKGVLSNLSLMQKVEVHVCLESENDVGLFSDAMRRGEELLAGSQSVAGESGGSDPLTRQNPLGGEQGFEFAIYWLKDASTSDSLEQQVRDSFTDVGVRLTYVQSGNPGSGNARFLEWKIFRSEGSALSERGYKEITKRLNAINNQYVEYLLQSSGLPSRKPATISSEVIRATDSGTSPLITFIPLVLVLMTMTGAVYPAIDLTAGERERGTMEILVAAPVSRMTILAGKFLAVLTVALLTASMNLISMFATLFALGLEGTVLGNVGPTMVIQVIVLMVVFAAFFSAVLLSITSVARSFKEAQAYLIPLMLMALTPGVFSLMPNLKMNGMLAVTPLVNTVLMGRDLLQGEVNILMFAIVLISTALYGVLALSLAARIFGSDAVLYGNGGSWTELLKRPGKTVAVAPIPVSSTCLAIVFSLFIILGGIPSRLFDSATGLVVGSGVTSILLFVGVPLLVASLTRVKVRSGFVLRLPSLVMWLIACLLGTSLWVFVYELEVSMLTDDRIEELRRLHELVLAKFGTAPYWAKLFAVAIAPAFCEEFFFRGFLQNSIRKHTSAWISVFTTGVVFGLFHVIVQDSLMLERLLPSTLLGIILGVLFEKSGSVFPGMLLHLLHNGLLISISEYESELSAMGIGTSEHQHIPIGWLACAAVPIVIAAILLFRANRPAEADDQTQGAHG